MVAAGSAKPSPSLYASSVEMALKKDGSIRCCVDVWKQKGKFVLFFSNAFIIKLTVWQE